jgi:hypothetical protein
LQTIGQSTNSVCRPKKGKKEKKKKERKWIEVILQSFGHSL